MMTKREQKEVGVVLKRNYIRVKALKKSGLTDEEVAKTLNLKKTEVKKILEIGDKHFEGAH